MKAPICKLALARSRTSQIGPRSGVLPGSEFCFFHDPSKAEKRRESQAQGGRQNRMKTLESSAQDVKIQDYGDAIALLAQTINQVRRVAR